MEDFLNSLAAIGSAISPQFIELALAVLLAVVMVIVVAVGLAMRKNEFIQANKKLFDMFIEFATNAIIFTAFHATEAELEPYRAKEAARELAGEFFIDYRMLYVMDKLEVWLNQHPGLDIEFDELLVTAEGLYRKVKHDPTLPDIAPPK